MVENNFLSTFKGKKVFITGHTGFKGAWLSVLLQCFGANIRGYSLTPPTTPSLFESIKSRLTIESIIGNINDQTHLNNSIIEFKPDFIFHLAAQPLVRQSYQDPLETFSTNIIGTANLLESVKLLDNECVVILVTTDKVYENLDISYAYNESDKLGGYDPYSSSKACAELVINSYRNSFFNIHNWNSHLKSISSVRAGNVIGGGDWAQDRLLPDIIKAAQEDKKVLVRNPHSIRPWQHVLDPLIGYITLASLMKKDPLKYSSAWNFGPTNETTLSVIELVDFTLHNLGYGSREIEENRSHLHEAKLLQLDISKAIHDLNWRPLFNSKIAVKLSVDWYKGFYLDSSKAFDLCMNDIEKYFQLLNE